MKKSARKAGREVTFELAAEPGSKVSVAGTFNHWDPTATPMTADSDTGVHKATLMLEPGRHEYKFVVNGEWRMDPDCPECVANAHGTQNSVMNVQFAAAPARRTRTLAAQPGAA